MVSLVSVVGLAKVESPAIEAGVAAVGFPAAFVGVVIALLVLLPESIAATRAAARDDVQVSLNLAYGSAMASIGLTIPTIAAASIWLDGPLALGLEPMQIVLLAISVVVGVLTVVPGPGQAAQRRACTWCCWRRTCSCPCSPDRQDLRHRSPDRLSRFDIIDLRYLDEGDAPWPPRA